MIGGGPSCQVDLAHDDGRTFYTNGELVRGELVLSESHRAIAIYKITGSLTCEEWVHVTQLEFKEHFHSISKVFDVPRNPIILKQGHPVRIPFELKVPLDDDLKLPPSFDLKHNSVMWKAKFSVEYRAGEKSADLDMMQLEHTIRLCRRSKKFQPLLDDPERIQFQRTAGPENFSVSTHAPDRGKIALGSVMSELASHLAHPLGVPSVDSRGSAGAVPKDLSLDLQLDVPAYGLVQTPFENGPRPGLYLSLNTSYSGLVLHEIAFDLVKTVTTSRRDPFDEIKHIARIRQDQALHPGRTQLDNFIGQIRPSGFTETFRTEWQELTHKLRLSFVFSAEEGGAGRKIFLEFAWHVSIKVLSEAYGL